MPPRTLSGAGPAAPRWPPATQPETGAGCLCLADHRPARRPRRGRRRALGPPPAPSPPGRAAAGSAASAAARPAGRGVSAGGLPPGGPAPGGSPGVLWPHLPRRAPALAPPRHTGRRRARGWGPGPPLHRAHRGARDVARPSAASHAGAGWAGRRARPRGRCRGSPARGGARQPGWRRWAWGRCGPARRPAGVVAPALAAPGGRGRRAEEVGEQRRRAAHATARQQGRTPPRRRSQRGTVWLVAHAGPPRGLDRRAWGDHGSETLAHGPAVPARAILLTPSGAHRDPARASAMAARGPGDDAHPGAACLGGGLGGGPSGVTPSKPLPYPAWGAEASRTLRAGARAWRGSAPGS
jgi:hypothetical protein